MRPRSLDEFLTKARVPYTTFRHAPAFTAMHAAAISHVPGRSWAKTVVCFADEEVVLAVVPAHYTIDFDTLRGLTGAARLRLASEREVADLYPDFEEGAMPPFGRPRSKPCGRRPCSAGSTKVGHCGRYAPRCPPAKIRRLSCARRSAGVCCLRCG